MGVLSSLGQPRREMQLGTVVSVTAGVATVTLGETDIEAQLTAQTAAVTAPATVYLFPMGDTWIVLASLL